MTWRQPNTSSLSQAGVSGQSLSEIMNENHHKIPFQSKFCFFDCNNYLARLLRGQEAVEIYGGTLGELLCKKADQGVKVKVMVWSEMSSGEFVGDKGEQFSAFLETFQTTHVEGERGERYNFHI